MTPPTSPHLAQTAGSDDEQITPPLADDFSLLGDGAPALGADFDLNSAKFDEWFNEGQFWNSVRSSA
jgi:hypothetical protein